MLDNITLGSKKNKPSISIIQEKQQEAHSDINSINTSDIYGINSMNIKSIDNYNLEALKKMAKIYSIGLSAKIDGKWKPLSKTELYNKILEYLKEKKSNH